MRGVGCKPVQSFRLDGSCVHVWRSAVCGKELGLFVQLGCVQDLVFMLDRLRANVNVFELSGPSRFSFSVIDGPQKINPGQVTVYSAVDGTELHSQSIKIDDPKSEILCRCSRVPGHRPVMAINTSVGPIKFTTEDVALAWHERGVKREREEFKSKLKVEAMHRPAPK